MDSNEPLSFIVVASVLNLVVWLSWLVETKAREGLVGLDAPILNAVVSVVKKVDVRVLIKLPHLIHVGLETVISLVKSSGA